MSKAGLFQHGHNITKPKYQTARDLYRLGDLSSLYGTGQAKATAAQQAAEV